VKRVSVLFVFGRGRRCRTSYFLGTRRGLFEALQRSISVSAANSRKAFVARLGAGVAGMGY
jgi:hypothetical protein